jgi:hypothetical protein
VRSRFDPAAVVVADWALRIEEEQTRNLAGRLRGVKRAVMACNVLCCGLRRGGLQPSVVGEFYQPKLLEVAAQVLPRERTYAPHVPNVLDPAFELVRERRGLV